METGKHPEGEKWRCSVHSKLLNTTTKFLTLRSDAAASGANVIFYLPEFIFHKPHLPFFFFISIFVLQSHPPIHQMAVSIFSPQTGTQKPNSTPHSSHTLVILSSPRFQVINGSGTAKPPPPPCSLLLFPLSNDIFAWQTGSQTDRWGDVWGTDPSHMWFPTAIHPHRFIYPLIAGAGRSVKHLPAPSAITYHSYSWIYSCTNWNCRVMFLLSNFHGATVRGIHSKSRCVRLFFFTELQKGLRFLSNTNEITCTGR